jgi:hypothetical protein
LLILLERAVAFGAGCRSVLLSVSTGTWLRVALSPSAIILPFLFKPGRADAGISNRAVHVPVHVLSMTPGRTGTQRDLTKGEIGRAADPWTAVAFSRMLLMYPADLAQLPLAVSAARHRLPGGPNPATLPC